MRYFIPAFFGALFLLLIVLWLPGLKYPIVSDTAFYSFLGESMWKDFRFELLGVPYAKHLPFHAFVSYPFVWLFGYSLGMKVSTLIAGYVTLVAAFLLLQEAISRKVAVLSVSFIAIHHAFVLMMHLGSADLLFTALFLFSLYGYIKAKNDARFYLLAFIAAGLSCITRYNGVPLFGLYAVHTLLYRREDIRTFFYAIPALLGGGIFCAWLLRNWFVFGDPMHTEYTSELSSHTLGFFHQVYSNTLYYLDPFHNILPLLFALSLWGMLRFGRQYAFLLCAMAAAWALTSFWWVQAMRFAFPGFVLMMGFAIVGGEDLWQRCVSKSTVFVRRACAIFVIITLCITHLGALCLYSFGECNAVFDRTVGVIPKDLGLTPEGFYAWHKARVFLRDHAEKIAPLYVSNPVTSMIWNAEQIAGKSVPIINENKCNSYNITQKPKPTDEVLYTTEESPHTSLVLQRCQ